LSIIDDSTIAERMRRTSSSKSAGRITANTEDRKRQGFEIQTVFAWPPRAGALECLSLSTGPIMLLGYALGGRRSPKILEDRRPAESTATLERSGLFEV
jgi:hypothetical protein